MSSVTAWLRATCLSLLITRAQAEDTKPSLAKIASPDVSEASGMATSPTQPDRFWVLNDSGGTTDLHLVGSKGENLGLIHLKDVTNRDWEDLASYLDGKSSWLVVADTGDNGARYATCRLHFLREPAIPVNGPISPQTLEPSRTLEFRYPDGARDCESVAVDLTTRTILLISKRTKPPEIYTLPLDAEGKEILTATRIGEVKVDTPKGMIHPFGGQPTGLSLSPDGKRLAILTYPAVFLYQRDELGEPWATVLAREAFAVQPIPLKQAEAVSFTADRKSVRVISEGLHSPILEIPYPSGKPTAVKSSAE